MQNEIEWAENKKEQIWKLKKTNIWISAKPDPNPTNLNLNQPEIIRSAIGSDIPNPKLFGYPNFQPEPDFAHPGWLK